MILDRLPKWLLGALTAGCLVVSMLLSYQIWRYGLPYGSARGFLALLLWSVTLMCMFAAIEDEALQGSYLWQAIRYVVVVCVFLCAIALVGALLGL